MMWPRNKTRGALSREPGLTGARWSCTIPLWEPPHEGATAGSPPGRTTNRNRRIVMLHQEPIGKAAPKGSPYATLSSSSSQMWRTRLTLPATEMHSPRMDNLLPSKGEVTDALLFQEMREDTMSIHLKKTSRPRASQWATPPTRYPCCGRVMQDNPLAGRG